MEGEAVKESFTEWTDKQQRGWNRSDLKDYRKKYTALVQAESLAPIGCCPARR
jgi:hypothetical protein